MEYCFTCGSVSTTKEHIVPKWLQRKFNLWNQQLVLPNGTSIQYRQLTIPVCSRCNNEILAPIEARIQSKKESNSDIWKWAAKIHYGLTRKHDFLEWDRSNPGYKIGQVINSSDILELDRHLAHSISGGFTTDPDPFGSVFIFKFDVEMEFNLANFLEFPAICINTGSVGYVVFIKDTGTLNRQPSIMSLYDKMATDSHVGKMFNFLANAWLHLCRFRFTYPIVMSPSFIVKIGSLKLIEEKPFDYALFEKVWTFLNAGKKAPIVSNDEYEKINGKIL